MKLDHRISNDQMKSLNAAVRVNKQSEIDAAGDFVNKQLGIKVEWNRTDASSWIRRFSSRLLLTTFQHLMLVVISLVAAIIVSIPLGIIAYKFPRAENSILGVIGIIQTLPSMALLVFMIPLLGLRYTSGDCCVVPIQFTPNCSRDLFRAETTLRAAARIGRGPRINTQTSFVQN
jgi:osmoprotectant transport system permease protein